MSKLTFILGGARSGKSIYAERLAEGRGGRTLYIATGEGLDDEMRGRIAKHRQGRPARWKTLELPLDVGRSVLADPPEADVIVLDCLTLLVSNLILKTAPDVDHPDEAQARARVETEMSELLRAVESIPAKWLIVSNEVGEGVVPAYPVGRLFRDLLGWANQRIAEKADEVYWMVAGIPVPIGQHRD
jgi:adenosylcobinamide kinase/adenosylcobinamide-phosphate guanylyltransferase